MSADLWVELLQSTLATSLAVMLVLLARKFLRLKLGARIAYATWGIVPFAGIAVLLPAQTNNPLLANTVSGAVGLPELVYVSLAAIPGTGPSALLLPLWLIGALAALATFTHRQWQFNRGVQNLAGSPYAQGASHGPAVVGILRPRIVLPVDFEARYSTEQQGLVIAHERLHLRRGDIPAQALATLLRCVFWFNPLIHFAAARFRFDQELACDADVLEAFPNSRRAYGEAMLKTQLADFGLPVGCHWQSSHPLKERIIMLSNPLPGTARRVFGMALVLAMVASGSYAAWAAQPVAALASGNEPTAREKPAPTRDTAPGVGSITDADVLTPPDYPAGVSKDQPGHVLLEVLVAADGTVKEARVVKSEPAGVFDDMTIQAALKWRFNTARNTQGNKVEGWVRVPVEFSPQEPVANSKAG
jgi:TonB family protein